MKCSVFVVDYKSSANSMVSFTSVCVYCCFCLLYVLWVTVETVSVYSAKPFIDGYIASIIFCFLYNSMQVVKLSNKRTD